jgi:hypothetical protein
MAAIDRGNGPREGPTGLFGQLQMHPATSRCNRVRPLQRACGGRRPVGVSLYKADLVAHGPSGHSPSRSWSGAAQSGLAALAVLILVVGCSEDPKAAPTTAPTSPPFELPAGIPNVGGALSPPGTQIAPGYRVVDGSFLVGPAIPAGSANRDDDAWTALAVVAGEPEGVLAGYVDQARERGLETSLDSFRLGEDRCGGLGEHPSVEYCVETMSIDGTGRNESLQLRYSRGVVGGEPTSLLLIEHLDYADGYPVDAPPELFADLPPRPDLGGHLELPDDWPELPRAGDALTPLLDTDPLRVVQGSRPVAPAWRVGPERCAVELSWMIQVEPDADPKRVFDAYLEQVGGTVEDVEPYELTLDDGTDVRFEPRTQVTLYDLNLTLVQPKVGTSWIRVDHCNTRA